MNPFSFRAILLVAIAACAATRQEAPVAMRPMELAEGNRFRPELAGAHGDELERMREKFSLEATDFVRELSFNRDEGKFAVPIDIDAAALEAYRDLQRLLPIESYFFGIPETVCLPDDRIQITDPTQYPWSANCQLVITLRNGAKAIGTGWLAGPRLVVTAGHCVHEGVDGEFFVEVEVIPGMNGPLRPFASQTSRNLRAASGWIQHGRVAEDYGAIVLDREFPAIAGLQPGHHTIAVVSDSVLMGREVYMSGYPADKSFGSQWADADPISQIHPERLRYMLDTYGGHSGSALLLVPENTVVGIHNYGGCPNYSTRITANVTRDIDGWLAESVAPPK
jgi:glutamyl endopeptidase